MSAMGGYNVALEDAIARRLCAEHFPHVHEREYSVRCGEALPCAFEEQGGARARGDGEEDGARALGEEQREEQGEEQGEQQGEEQAAIVPRPPPSQPASRSSPGAADVCARLNHGSFGTAPSSVLAFQSAFRAHWLRQPDRVYFHHIRASLADSRKEIASMINSSVDRLVVIDNVSVGAIMMAQRVMWDGVAAVRSRAADGRGATEGSDEMYVVMFDNTYGAVKNAFEHYCGRAGVLLHIIEMPFPLPLAPGEAEAKVLRALEDGLRVLAGKKIRMAVVDHISSNPSMVLPVADMVALCRAHGVQEVFVDGAHAIGQVDVDVAAIGADFYMSNVHKWCFAPTSAAFFHCGGERATHAEGRDNAVVHHPMVSHPFGEGLEAECAWVGTRDYSAMASAAEAVRWYRVVGEQLRRERGEAEAGDKSAEAGGRAAREVMQSGGGEESKRAGAKELAAIEVKQSEGLGDGRGRETRDALPRDRPPMSSAIMASNHEKAWHWANALARAWGTEVAVPRTMTASLAMIELPPVTSSRIRSPHDALRVRNLLRERYKVEAVTFFHAPSRRSFIRLSAQLYNVAADFERLRDAVLAMEQYC